MIVAEEKNKALLISIVTPDITAIAAEESLAELERLVTTLGLKVVAREYQKRPSLTGGTVVGQGKLEFLARYTGGKGSLERASFGKRSKASEKFDEIEEDKDEEVVELPFYANENAEESKEITPEEMADVVVFDCDLTPSQLRNVENALGVEVMDRTGVIIEIFSRHAKTRSARLQVEIARLNYLAPRLRETGQASERQAGRGSGESDLEMDRRKIRDRQAELKAELAAVQKEQINRRSKRENQLTVALVGYTNAGKSSTMRALTGSEVLVENKLFATLDTTVRAMQPETHPRILVSDTVGFIKKLPHDLVASFRSTLDEALHASLLLYVVDGADPTFPSQLETTREVLKDVGVEDTPSFVVLNKADMLSEQEKNSLKREFPLALIISTRNKDDIKLLRDKILKVFEKDMVDEEIFAPYVVKGIVGEIRANTRVLKEEFEEAGVRYFVRGRSEDIERIKKTYLESNE
ncbi:MAG: GTPase HflX [Bdellovibrionota bacterium]